MVNVKRLLLEEYKRQRSIPFAWGTADCLSFVADTAKLLTGSDPAAHLRGKYVSEMEWARIMVARKWRSLGDAAASMLAEVPVAQARSGDWVVIVNDDDTETLGVVVGHQVLARAPSGLGLQVLTKAARAFRVG